MRAWCRGVVPARQGMAELRSWSSFPWRPSWKRTGQRRMSATSTGNRGERGEIGRGAHRKFVGGVDQGRGRLENTNSLSTRKAVEEDVDEHESAGLLRLIPLSRAILSARRSSWRRQIVSEGSAVTAPCNGAVGAECTWLVALEKKQRERSQAGREREKRRR